MNILIYVNGEEKAAKMTKEISNIHNNDIISIKRLNDKNIDIFYNGSGDPDMYRNNIKHISHAVKLDLLKVLGSDYFVKTSFWIYNRLHHQLRETTVGEIIPVINLVTLK